ncbi:MAG: hypothetical protein ACOX35_02085 [Bacillota bacterium]|jgi:hypothetical protein|nr:hypothetical protein [Candidatus Fermentithermobacillaceae bacterium]
MSFHEELEKEMKQRVKIAEELQKILGLTDKETARLVSRWDSHRLAILLARAKRSLQSIWVHP